METQKIDYQNLSPFELKDSLVKWAKESTVKSDRVMIDAGRGNPNWVATTPRESFFLLGQFALSESKRIWDETDLGGMPDKEGIAKRLSIFLQTATSPGGMLLKKILDYSESVLGFDADEFVFELTDSIIGDNYPFPDRMQPHAEKVVHKYLMKELCDNRELPGRFDLFAVEGGTAAMCYIFNSLVTNKILNPGDTIAIGTPIFTPYLEIPKLDAFKFKTVEIKASQMSGNRHTWQYLDSELRKLEDPNIKAFFVVHPSNPGSTAMEKRSLELLVEIIKTKRPDLLILTDDVYGTFVPNFRSLASECPENTILVYSYSKHFGCTGWRLGVIGMYENHIVDRMIAQLPEETQKALADRYRTLWLEPEKVKFIDRMVADSRNVALHHTAGLSIPQQAQMILLSLFSLVDKDDSYKKRVREIVRKRMHKLFDGLGVPMEDHPLRTYYYIDIDLGEWGLKTIGPEFAEYIREHHDPLDIVFTLAKKHGIVLLNGSGFDAPPWSARVALANRDDESYEKIGKEIAVIVQDAIDEWKAAEKPKRGLH